MAGFILKNLDHGPRSFISNIQRNIRYMSILGMKWDQNIIKQSKAIGISEAQEDSLYGLYGQHQIGASMDIAQKEFIAFFDKEYPTRRDFLRRFAMNGEIEHVVEVIADETIIIDDSGYFAYPNTRKLKSVLKAEKAKEIIDNLNESYKKVYYAFGFNTGHDGWHYVKKFLIDGFLAFEIIYDGEGDEDAKNILGFKELDPVTLEPEMRINEDDGMPYRVWIQFRGDAERQRTLVDSNVIYISWARGNFISRLSYVERLVRSFNMLRTLENSRIIWNIINAQHRMKIVVPVGTQSEVKARTRLSQLRGMYKEDITIDYHSGEVAIDGTPNFSFAKQYIIPSKDGTQTEIDSMAPGGYDLSDTTALNYFWKRFIIETKVPKDRFSLAGSEESSGSNWTTGGEGIAREEIRFSYFINRIRSMFQELLLKPTWIQFCLKHPIFAEDKTLKGAIGLEFIEENLFTEAKKREIISKGASIVETLMNIKEQTVNDQGEITMEGSYFDPKFLIEKFMDWTDEDLKLNDRYKKERKTQLDRISIATKRIMAIQNNEGGEGGGDLGGGFGDMGGGFGDLGGGDLGGGAPEEPAGEEGGLEI